MKRNLVRDIGITLVLLLAVPQYHLSAEATDTPPDYRLITYYQANFINVASWGWGTRGIVTSKGVGALDANPAGILSDKKIELLGEGGFFRTGVNSPVEVAHGSAEFRFSEFNPLFVGGLMSDGEDAAIGFAYYEPQAVKTRQHVDLEGIDPDISSRYQVTRITLGLAVKVNPAIVLGIGYVYESHMREGAEFRINSNWYVIDEDKESVQRVMIGTRTELGPLRIGTSVLTSRLGTEEDKPQATPDDLPDKGTTKAAQPLWIGSRSYAPVYSVGVTYNDRLAVELKVHKDDQELVEIGGGIRQPIDVHPGFRSFAVSAGLFRRTGGAPDPEGIDQWFLTTGVELAIERFTLAASAINGHWFNDKPERLSELVCSIGYSLSQ